MATPIRHLTTIVFTPNSTTGIVTPTNANEMATTTFRIRMASFMSSFFGLPSASESYFLCRAEIFHLIRFQQFFWDVPPGRTYLWAEDETFAYV